MENYRKINKLIAKHIDVHKEYIDSLSYIKGTSLYALLRKLADKRRVFSLELTAISSMMYPDQPIDVEGTFAGAMSRGWLDLKASINLEDDKSILKHSLDAEEYAQTAYTTLLEEENHSQKYIDIFKKHLNTIATSIKELHTIEELL